MFAENLGTIRALGRVLLYRQFCKGKGKQGYTILYANVVEDTGRLYMWNVTDLNKVKGIKTTVAPCFASIYNNPVIVAKPIYELPLTSAFVNADVKSYIDQYLLLYANHQQTEKENKR